ncbi:DUF6745 domain-containing protein [Nonomuraea dietziae]|uniref:DUF6745 domain-containing protein n=1 Tax=Nonomuraea dietziae TaxID=65515 RepID=UPI0033D9CEB0
MSVPRRLEAADIRDEWLGWALSTLPADQTAAEAAISELYERAGRPAPRFLWVDSPNAAMEFVPAGIPMREFVKTLSIASRLATLGSELREALDRRVGHPWALSWGQGEPDPLDAEVRDPLRDFVRDGVCTPLRLALPLAERLTWYGQHDAYWIAHYDAWRRIGGRTFRGLNGQLDLWATLARSCGWWWPMEELCVVSLRPVSVRTEEQRLHSEQGPAVAYADGWSVHAWRGTRVPWWVIADPTPDRIAQEPNIEVRRCAIERLGWEAYIEQAGLRLVATAHDPGNPGFDLLLYDLPDTVWGRRARVLLATNGSVERDGRRRRYGLGVPGHLDDPVAAAAWTYGLSTDHYAQLARRT